MNHWLHRLPYPLLREALLLMRVNRPIGTWLLMWPSLWALTAAQQGLPKPSLLFIFVLGAFLMRSAGCVANDLADRNFDPLVARTKERPLAAKRISVRVAMWLLLSLLTASLVLALQLNPLALSLCLVGAFLALSYPFSKRFIQLPQFYMGAAFGWGVIIAWAAATNTVGTVAWILFAATLTWAAAYDTIYAMMDRDDDIKIGVKSTAILFGRFDILAVAGLYIITLALLAWAGWLLKLSFVYYVFLAICLLHMARQVFSIRTYRQEILLRAFVSNQWIGFLVFTGMLLGSMALS